MTQNNYQAWDINEANWPANGTLEAKLRFLLHYAVLAPSVHNTQPWLFNIKKNSIRVDADQSFALREHDPNGRNLYLSLGATVVNLLIAADYFGLTYRVRVENKTVVITFGDTIKTNLDRTSLFKAISERRSNKFFYQKRPIPAALIQDLENLSEKGVRISVITNRRIIKQMAELHAQSITASAYPKFVKELVAWLRLPKTKSSDGMPAFVVGLSQPQAKILRWLLLKKPGLLKILAKKDFELLGGAPAVIVISTKNDTLSDWIMAGQKFEEAMLMVTASGLGIQPMTAMIEQKNANHELVKLANLNSRYAQALLRFGFPTTIPHHTPRRDIWKFLSHYVPAIDRLIEVVGLEVQKKQVVIGKYTINYVTAGKGKPILLIHGANLGWAQWHQNIAELAKHFQVFALDLPGAGESTRLNFITSDLDKDFLAVVDKFIELQGWSKIDIVGSSFGGWIALNLAAQNKPVIGKVVLSNPIGFTDYVRPKFRPIGLTPLAKLMTRTVLRPVKGNDKLENFMREVFADKQLPLTFEFVDYFFELSKSTHNALFISRLTTLRGMAPGIFRPEVIKKIQKPILLIWGQKDPLMPYERVRDNFKLVKNMQISLLPDVGHMPPVEDSQHFNELVIDFLGQ